MGNWMKYCTVAKTMGRDRLTCVKVRGCTHIACPPLMFQMFQFYFVKIDRHMSADSEKLNIIGGIWMKYCTLAKTMSRDRPICVEVRGCTHVACAPRPSRSIPVAILLNLNAQIAPLTTQFWLRSELPWQDKCSLKKGPVKRSRSERHFWSLIMNPYFYFVDFTSSNYVFHSEPQPLSWLFLKNQEIEKQPKPPKTPWLLVCS